jgi:hypothetical protein
MVAELYGGDENGSGVVWKEGTMVTVHYIGESNGSCVVWRGGKW